ncbi:hypothetical protein V8G54_025383 [Vigna mungo]|uniref:Transmembrane protein n=1 Tax=Vigna mungo TaxID=3915 RepID=A0AAQ3RNW3_VIGMU
MLPLPLFQFQSLLNLDYSININNMNTETTAESRSTTPFTDFLNRMHHPASLDLVRSIKRQSTTFHSSCKRNQSVFIVSFIITATFTSVLPIYPFMSSIIQYYYRHGVL